MKIPLQRDREFYADEVAFVLKSTTGFPIRHRPILPDNSQYDPAPGKVTLYGLDEVLPGLDCVDVHEDSRLAEVSAEPVIKASRGSCAVLTSIADENPA